jgi:hypothetical protein
MLFFFIIFYVSEYDLMQYLQVRLLDRQRYSKYEDLSPRLVYPVIYVTDGLWIRRNKSLYSRMVAPLLISISNDTSYGTDNEVYVKHHKPNQSNNIFVFTYVVCLLSNRTMNFLSILLLSPIIFTCPCFSRIKYTSLSVP